MIENHYLEFKVLQMPHLYGQAFGNPRYSLDVLLTRKEEVVLVGLPRNILFSSGRAFGGLSSQDRVKEREAM